jgi:cell division protein FtsB
MSPEHPDLTAARAASEAVTIATLRDENQALTAEVARLRTELADLEHQRDTALYQRDTARIGGYRDVGI